MNGLGRVAAVLPHSYLRHSVKPREEKFTLRSIRNPRTFATAIAAALVALAMTAPVASAWTPENQGFTVSGTLTFKMGGTEARTCSPKSVMYGFGVVHNLDQFYGQGSWNEGIVLTCKKGSAPSGELWWRIKGDGFLKEGKQMMAIGGDSGTVWGTERNPWAGGSWSANAVANTVWTNATATTPSNIVFSESKIGEVEKYAVTATGTLYFKSGFTLGKLTLP